MLQISISFGQNSPPFGTVWNQVFATIDPPSIWLTKPRLGCYNSYMMRYFTLAYILLTVLVCGLCTGCATRAEIQPVQYINLPWGWGGKYCSERPESC